MVLCWLPVACLDRACVLNICLFIFSSFVPGKKSGMFNDFRKRSDLKEFMVAS